MYQGIPASALVTKFVQKWTVHFQIFFIYLNVEVAIVLDHHVDDVVDNLDLRNQLLNFRVIEQLQRLCTAFFLRSWSLQDDATDSITFENRIANADDILPALVLVARIEVFDLLGECHLLPLLRRDLFRPLLLGHLCIDLLQSVLTVGCVHSRHSHPRKRRCTPAWASSYINALLLEN
eukprot:Skav204850  [mRNA]  locus=scaffold1883:131446:135536:+ [translate_table: standard]